VLGILLAAGFSRRFGASNKLLEALPDGCPIALASADLPRHLNIDLGSGNSFVFPIAKSVEANVGDVVTVIATHSTHNLASARADFFKDLPRVTVVRCKYDNRACVDLPENGLGVTRRLE
jgi:plastocyanin